MFSNRGGRLVLGGRDCLDLKLAIQWIDLREHLQETIKTTIKYRGFPAPFPLNQFIEPWKNMKKTYEEIPWILKSETEVQSC